MIPISNAQKNYLFILAILEDYATRSKFIQYINGVNNSFGVGPIDKINEVIKTTPYMWITDLGSTMIKADDRTGFNNIEHKVRIYIADKLIVDDTNQDSAINNTKEELFAIIAELTQHPYYIQNKIKLSDDDIDIESEYEVDDDYLVRSYADLTFIVPFQYTYCSNPTDTIPLYNTTTIPYFNSATVSICSILSQCGVITTIQGDIKVTNITSSATPSIYYDVDQYNITALATNITSVSLSGTFVDRQRLIVTIKDNGTARTITWGSSFNGTWATLPTTTVVGNTWIGGFIYNATTSKYECVASFFSL